MGSILKSLSSHNRTDLTDNYHTYIDSKFVNLSKQLGTKLGLIGGKMEGIIDMNNNCIVNAASPVDSTDVTNKQYVDDVLDKKLNKIVVEDLDLAHNKIKNVASPVEDADVVTKEYMDSTLSKSIPQQSVDTDIINLYLHVHAWIN